MTTLIRTEWLKMRKYNAFWWIMGLTLLSYPGINYLFYQVISREIVQDPKYGQFAKMAIGSPYEFPETWHTVMYFSSWFIFIPAVVVIMLICNEYSFKTHRQNIIDGWGRGGGRVDGGICPSPTRLGNRATGGIYRGGRTTSLSTEPLVHVPGGCSGRDKSAMTP